MKVLSIGSDRKLFDEGSFVSSRVKEYGQLVDELHIINMCDASEGFETKQLSDNVWVYPTNSVTSLLRPLDAARIGKHLVLERGFVRGQSVITAQDIESGWAGMRVKKKWRIPLELQLHTDIFSPYFAGFQNKVRKFFARDILRKADSVRVVSEELKSKILELKSGANVDVLPIYVDRGRIEDAALSFDVHVRYELTFVVLSVARLNKEKNVSLAIKAVALAREKFPNIGLVVVGDGPELGQLKSLAKKLKIQNAVKFAGWQNDLASFYKTSNVFLQTSLFEGYGLSLVEAGLSGLPVITTPVGIATELEHGKDAYIYPSDRPELFAEGIVDLVQNNFKRDNMRINLKRTLSSKLISKEEYLEKLKKNWERISKKVA